MGFVLGLTGTIGCGKTAVAVLLRAIGEARWPPPAVTVIDADALARAAVQPGTPALAEIAREFGPGAIAASGELDRSQALARVVFADRRALARLNAIVHPRVREAEVQRMREAAGSRLIVLDVPLLYESGMQDLMDRVMVVTVSEAQRFRRLKQRGLREAEVIARLGSQIPQARKIAMADAVVDNAGPLDATRLQVEAWLDRWQVEGLI